MSYYDELLKQAVLEELIKEAYDEDYLLEKAAEAEIDKIAEEVLADADPTTVAVFELCAQNDLQKLAEAFGDEGLNLAYNLAAETLLDYAEEKRASVDLIKEALTAAAGLSKKKRSQIVRKARRGGDIGKRGKNFQKVVQRAKKYGATNPEAVAASVMWGKVGGRGPKKRGRR